MGSYLHNPRKDCTMFVKRMPDGAPWNPWCFEGAMSAKAGPPMPVRIPRVRYDANADANLRELEVAWYAVYPDDNPHAVFEVQPRGKGFVTWWEAKIGAPKFTELAPQRRRATGASSVGASGVGASGVGAKIEVNLSQWRSVIAISNLSLHFELVPLLLKPYNPLAS